MQCNLQARPCPSVFLPELNDLAGRQNTVDVRKHSQQNQSDAGADREGRAS